MVTTMPTLYKSTRKEQCLQLVKHQNGLNCMGIALALQINGFALVNDTSLYEHILLSPKTKCGKLENA